MSFLDAFKRRKANPDSVQELTSFDNQMEIKTLDQALEKVGTLTAQIQGLETTVTEREQRIVALNADLQSCMATFGITKITETGATEWKSTRVTELQESLNVANSERDVFKAHLDAANARIIDLEKDQKTVSARAREFLAAQGGRALPVSGSVTPAPRTRQQLAEAMDQANRSGNQDELKRLYTELKKLNK